jgi:hypothetical protein
MTREPGKGKELRRASTLDDDAAVAGIADTETPAAAVADALNVGDIEDPATAHNLATLGLTVEFSNIPSNDARLAPSSEALLPSEGAT